MRQGRRQGHAACVGHKRSKFYGKQSDKDYAAITGKHYAAQTSYGN